jgi:hypothetical protein
LRHRFEGDWKISDLCAQVQKVRLCFLTLTAGKQVTFKFPGFLWWQFAVYE